MSVFYFWHLFSKKLYQNKLNKNIKNMLFRNLNDLRKLFFEFDSFDESFFNQPHLKGKEQVNTGSDENGEWERKTYVSDTGLFSYSFFTRKNNVNGDDEINKLKNELNLCVESQEFEKAVELRDKIKKLELNKEEINKLKLELNESIKNQDFEKSIIIRDKLKSFK
jgi:excinuclease UvrABC helicase subunit UvrB